MTKTVTFDQALDTIMHLSLEDQQLLIEITHKRQSEARRLEIAQNAKSARRLYEANELPQQTFDEMMSDLHNFIE